MMWVRNRFDQERDLIDVAPAPFLAGLERGSDGVCFRCRVFRRVTARRRVAAAHPPAHKAHAKVDPSSTRIHAIGAADHAARRDLFDLVEVRALVHRDLQSCRDLGESLDRALCPRSRRRTVWSSYGFGYAKWK